MIGRRPSSIPTALIVALILGCQRSEPAPAPPIGQAGPPPARRSEPSLRVFSGSDETPGASHAFSGAVGSVRVAMEIEGGSGPPGSVAPPPSINDVLFKAEGDGRISVAFRRPWPEHPNGRVTISCESGGETSTAEFEPELWYHLPAAIVAFEPGPPEAEAKVVPGKEVVLGRYVARNIPRDVRVSFKAIFTKAPISPRTKAGLKATR